MDLLLCGYLPCTSYCGISIKPAELKSSQANRFGCNNNHNYLIDNKIGRFILHYIILVNGNWLLVIDYYHLPLTNYHLPITSYQSARLGPIKVVENRRQKAEVKRPKTEVLSSVFCLLSLLPPVVRVPDGFRLNVELSAQHFYQRLCPFYLKIGWGDGFVISYNTDINSLVGWCLAKIRWPLVF